MTPSSDSKVLLELAERCEAATGPDRELDDEIFAFLGHCKHEPKVEAVEVDGELDLLTTCAKCGSSNVAYRLHRYTASLDAAMTLLPETVDGGWRLTFDKPLMRKGWAEVWTHEDAEPGDGFFRAAAKSPALALTAAALRARASLKTDGTK